MSLEEVRRTKAAYADVLLRKKNVVGCGVGYKEIGGERSDDLAVVVSVVEKEPKERLPPHDLVPERLDRVPTDVRQTGRFRALQGPTGRWRPAPGGVSCGHIDITTGTLGCLVQREGRVYILSNNHVLANSNQGAQGDPILQPGPHDGGTLEDRIASLETFVEITFGTANPTCPVATSLATLCSMLAKVVGSHHRFSAFQEEAEANLVDAAIARPLSDDVVERQILGIGEPQGVAEGTLGLLVRKSGRTTGLTSDEIQQVDATVKVQYAMGRVATFTDQLVAGAMSAGGDSGSAVLDESNRVIGLLFAGSESTTVFNRIQNVLEALNLQIAL